MLRSRTKRFQKLFSLVWIAHVVRWVVEGAVVLRKLELPFLA